MKHLFSQFVKYKNRNENSEKYFWVKLNHFHYFTMTWFCYLLVRSRDTHMIASSFCKFKINSTEIKGLKKKQGKNKT